MSEIGLSHIGETRQRSHSDPYDYRRASSGFMPSSACVGITSRFMSSAKGDDSDAGCDRDERGLGDLEASL